MYSIPEWDRQEKFYQIKKLITYQFNRYEILLLRSV